MNDEPHPFLNVGASVKIRRGPLEGMTGIIVRKKNSVRIILSLDVIMSSISVEVDGHDLEVVSDSSVPRDNISAFQSSHVRATP